MTFLLIRAKSEMSTVTHFSVILKRHRHGEMHNVSIRLLDKLVGYRNIEQRLVSKSSPHVVTRQCLSAVLGGVV